MKATVSTLAAALLLLAQSAIAGDGRRTVPMTPVTMTSPPWNSGRYTYDGAGNITAIGSDSFSYDLVSRLTSATVKGNTQAYTYDPFGNRLTGSTMSHGCSGGMDCAMSVTVTTATNRLATDTIGGASENVQYDSMGDVTYLAGTTFTYDGLGSLVTRNDGGGPFYVYDANDERIGSHTSMLWQWTLRDVAGRVLREYTASTAAGTTKWSSNSWTWTRDHVYAGDKMLASVAQSGSSTVTQHFHLDHLGTPRLITVDGTEVAFKTYYPFGAEAASAPIESPEETHKFTGHEFDDMHNGRFVTDYMHARYYNATAGRFLSVDSQFDEDTPQNSQKWNRYSYATNNPIRYSDPDGRSVWDTVNGYFNAFISDFGLTVRRSGNADFQIGQLNGDRAAAASGFVIATGGTTTAIVGSPTGVAIVGGGAVAGVGVLGMTNASIHLAENKNSQSGGSGTPQYKETKPGVSGKEGAKDIPSWAQGQRPKVGESGKDFAKRVLDQQYGAGKWKETGPGSEYNKLKKYADRNFIDPK